MELQLRAQDAEHAGVVPRLLDKVRRAAAHGLNGEIDVGKGCHDEDGETGVVGTDGGEQVQTFLAGGGVAGVVEVDEEAVEGVGGEVLEDGGGIARGLEVEALGFEEEVKGLEDAGLVVGDEQACGLRVRWGVRGVWCGRHGWGSGEVMDEPARADSIEMRFASRVRPRARSSSMRDFWKAVRAATRAESAVARSCCAPRGLEGGAGAEGLLLAGDLEGVGGEVAGVGGSGDAGGGLGEGVLGVADFDADLACAAVVRAARLGATRARRGTGRTWRCGCAGAG